MNRFANLILVGGGGFIGSVLRYVVGGLAQTASGSARFPYGTIVINVAGCLAIGFLSQLAEARGAFSAQTRGFLVIGVLGGFTTFSAFANESVNLLLERERLAAALDVAAHIALGLGGVLAGRVLAGRIWG